VALGVRSERLGEVAVDLSHHLIGLIESARLELGGERLRVRFVSVQPRPGPPLEPIGAAITVATIYKGQEHFGEVVFGLTRLSNERDEQYVVEHLAETLRQVISGELPPGALNYL
jgi:hypothetical protein